MYARWLVLMVQKNVQASCYLLLPFAMSVLTFTTVRVKSHPHLKDCIQKGESEKSWHDQVL